MQQRNFLRRPGSAAVWSLTLPLLFGISHAWGQGQKVVRIGILTDAMIPWHDSTMGFRDGLKDLGYIEGKSIVFEARAARGEPSRVSEMNRELVSLKPDLLFCVSDACRPENSDIPMLFVQVGDPIDHHLVRSIAHPGGNITGIANLRGDLTAKRLELFKEVVPALRRILVTFDPRDPEELASVQSAKSAGTRLGVTVLEQPITDRFEIEPGLAKLHEGGADGILIVQAGTNLNIPGRSFEVALANNIPTMYVSSFWAEIGALATYGPNQYTQGRQAARLAQKILMGTPPSEIPVELAERIDFIINLKAANRLGIKIPPELQVRADRIIE
jgi:putative tryptophan/tyrosine transport system substrate-binding protein